MDVKALARTIDHTLLDASATEQDLARVCDQALEHGFYGVCVYPDHLGFVSRRLEGTAVVPMTVVGFPDGELETDDKSMEAALAALDGAAEMDMVVHPGALKARNFRYVFADIVAVVGSAGGIPVKVILETGRLEETEIAAGCAVAKAAGAQYVKTSTGMGPRGATAGDVRLMRAMTGKEFGVKASGGIRDLDTALELLAAGADRLGTSRSVEIIEEALDRG
jgi:deoxyribose-phosphate aldolase